MMILPVFLDCRTILPTCRTLPVPPVKLSFPKRFTLPNPTKFLVVPVEIYIYMTPVCFYQYFYIKWLLYYFEVK